MIFMPWLFLKILTKKTKNKPEEKAFMQMHALVIPATTKIFREEGFYPFVNIIPSTVLQAFFPLTFLEKGKSLLYKFLKLNASSLLVLSPFAPFCANISVTSCKFNVFRLLTCSSSPLCNYEPMCWCFKCFVLKCVTSKFTKKPNKPKQKGTDPSPNSL